MKKILLLLLSTASIASMTFAVASCGNKFQLIDNTLVMESQNWGDFGFGTHQGSAYSQNKFSDTVKSWSTDKDIGEAVPQWLKEGKSILTSSNPRMFLDVKYQSPYKDPLSNRQITSPYYSYQFGKGVNNDYQLQQFTMASYFDSDFGPVDSKSAPMTLVDPTNPDAWTMHFVKTAFTATTNPFDPKTLNSTFVLPWADTVDFAHITHALFNQTGATQTSFFTNLLANNWNYLFASIPAKYSGKTFIPFTMGATVGTTLGLNIKTTNPTTNQVEEGTIQYNIQIAAGIKLWGTDVQVQFNSVYYDPLFTYGTTTPVTGALPSAPIFFSNWGITNLTTDGTFNIFSEVSKEINLLNK